MLQSLILLSSLLSPAALAQDTPVEAAADAGASVAVAAAEEAAPQKGWSVTRSVEINAAPEFIWPYISDFSTWKEWTAWNAELDPEATWTVGGEPGTVGHTSAWDGPTMGEGAMTMTAADPATGVSYDLFFDGKGTANPGSIALAPTDNGTLVTWSNTGKLGLIGRLFFAKKINQAIGVDFEMGLARLDVKATADAAYAAKLAEAKAAYDAADKKATDAEAAAKGKAEVAEAKAADAAAKRAEAEAARRKADKQALTAEADALDAEVATLNTEAAEAKTSADEARASAKSLMEAFEALKSGGAKEAAGAAMDSAKAAAAEAAAEGAEAAGAAAAEGKEEAGAAVETKGKGALDAAKDKATK